MDVFDQNHKHLIPVKQVHKVIEKQPWTAGEKKTIQDLFKAHSDTHGNISGGKISELFKTMHRRPDHGLETHHIHQFQKQLEHPFQQTVTSPSAKVFTSRIRF